MNRTPSNAAISADPTASTTARVNARRTVSGLTPVLPPAPGALAPGLRGNRPATDILLSITDEPARSATATATSITAAMHAAPRPATHPELPAVPPAPPAAPHATAPSAPAHDPTPPGQGLAGIDLAPWFASRGSLLRAIPGDWFIPQPSHQSPTRTYTRRPVGGGPKGLSVPLEDDFGDQSWLEPVDVGPEAHEGPPTASVTRLSPPLLTNGEQASLPTIGAVIDKYQIEEHLGSGGFAEVYRATHLLMRSPVALKVLDPLLVMDQPHLAEQLCQEARYSALINHPNVVRVFDVTHSARLTYIVMEYIDGMSLAKAISRRPLHLRDTLRIALDVCAGLRAAQEKGLIHRDIKPGNILISSTGGAKIVDLGLVRHHHLEGSLGTASGNAAVPQDVVGTPAYMAPEQVTDPAHTDFRGDIYALGATLFHAAVGRAPFPLGDPMQLIQHHLHHEPPSPSSLVPDLPQEFSRLVKRMMAKHPSARHQSYDELMADIHHVNDVVRSTSTATLQAGESGALFERMRRLFARRRPPT
jgi:hypothetical protein